MTRASDVSSAGIQEQRQISHRTLRHGENVCVRCVRFKVALRLIFTMKTKSVRYCAPLLILGLAFLIPTIVRAGGNTGQVIAKFEPAKSTEQIEQLKAGDTVVKVCRACK